MKISECQCVAKIWRMQGFNNSLLIWTTGTWTQMKMQYNPPQGWSHTKHLKLEMLILLIFSIQIGLIAFIKDYDQIQLSNIPKS